jgi:hypothetical protein
VVFWSCASGLGGKIWGVGFFFLLLCLLWLEHGSNEGATVSTDKPAAADLLLLRSCKAEPPWPAMEARGRGDACGGIRRSFFWPAVETRRRGNAVGFLWRRGDPATSL